ncbi:LLM class flavin-dependent oxidoreductase, partial [Candidatus Frankia alpina]
MTISMRFGLPGGRGDLDGASSTSTVELARVAETLGYDSLWFTDGHLSSVGSQTMKARSSPIPLSAAVAASTSRIRIGFTALHLTLHDPIRLAADLATLDRLSGGRVTLGAGWPIAPYTRAYQGAAPVRVDLPDALDTIVGYWRGR